MSDMSYMKTQPWLSRNRNLRIVSILIVCCYLAACNRKVNLSNKNKNVISGTIYSPQESSSEFTKTSEQKKCSGSNVELFSLDDNGKKNLLLGTTKVNETGSYTFSKINSSKLNINKDLKSSKYLIELQCNGILYKRCVTGTTEQNLSQGTSLLSWLFQTEVSSEISTTDSTTWADIYKPLEKASTMSSAYSILSSDSKLKSKFEKSFGVQPEILLHAIPEIIKIEVPLIYDEEISQLLTALATHWLSDYEIAYQWKLDSKVISTSSNFNFSPSANSQGSHVIQMFIGKKDTSGNFDFSKPYFQKSFPIVINNKVLPQPPPLSLLSPEYTSNTNVLLRLTTGPEMDGNMYNCKNFSSLALIEDAFPGLTVAPMLSSSYNIICSTASFQDFSFNLSGVDGVRSLRLWARDESGVVSNSSQNISIVLDRTAPNLELLTMTGSQKFKGGSSAIISWRSTEVNPVLNSVSIEYTADNGISWSTIASSQPNSGNYNWVLPTISSSQVKLRLKMSDLAGNVGTVESSSTFSIDSTPPNALVFSRTSAALSNSLLVTLAVTCDADFDGIYFSNSAVAPLASDSGWQTCASIMSFLTTSGDGLKTIYAYTKDSVGLISGPSSVTMTLDQTNPTLSFASFTSSQVFRGGTVQSVNWTASDINWGTQKIDLSYSIDNGSTFVIIANLDNTGVYSWSLPLINSSQVRLKISGCDLAGNCTSVVSAASFTIDSTGPVLTKLILNNGNTSSMQSSVLVDMAVNDNFKVTHFCLKLSSTQPILSDPCWIAVNAPLPGVTPSADISFANYYYQLGLSKGTYDIKAWAKDEAGNISSNLGTLAVDRYSINYDSGTPPSISKGYVANKDNPSFPITYNDSNVSLGGTIYVKWNAADNEGLITSPISIQYSTNDVSFLPISGATRISNGQNGACTVDSGYTGCAVLVSPVSGYYVLRIVAEDNSGLSTFMTLNAMNQSSIRMLAGNTDSGLDGSASSAVFNRYVNNGNAAYPAKNKLVVSDDGKIFYIDPLRGLLWIDPSTGLLKTFIPATGVSTGDGGFITSATLSSAKGIALDYSNRLIILDGTRFRRVNLSTMTISTIIGGGANANPTSEILSSELQITGTYSDSGATIIPLPNGNIIFNVSGTLNYFTYRDNDQKVSKFTVSGPGLTGLPTADWSGKTVGDLGIKFNPTTSAIEFIAQGIYWNFTGDSYFLHARINPISYQAEAPFDLPFNVNNLIVGMDGNLYSGIRYGFSISKYNSSANTKSTLVGNGASTFTPCSDGTLATACPVSISAAFVAKNGRIYFNDNGLIRTIDDAGKILTLFGQYTSAGDGGLALSARFGSIRDIKFGVTGTNYDKIIVLDINSSTFREFQIAGNLNFLANANFSWDGSYRFETDTATGDIFHNDAYAVKKFIRTTSTWQTVVGGGATDYFSPLADGLVGTAIKISNYKISILGFINNKIYRMLRYWNGTATVNSMIKAYDVSDSYRQSHFAGDSTNGLSTDTFSGIMYFQDPADSVNKFFWNPNASNKVYAGTSYGSGVVFATMPHSFYAFTARVEATGINFYYCGTNGLLYKFNKNTSTETQLTWSSPTLKCLSTARSILWNPYRSSLILVVEKNGLNGIAEYPLP